MENLSLLVYSYGCKLSESGKKKVAITIQKLLNRPILWYFIFYEIYYDTFES